VATDPAPPAGHEHFVVCGQNNLASRIVEELAMRYGEPVTVIMRSAKQGHGPRIAALPGVRIIERPAPDRQAFLDADLESARALALLDQDDLGNFHAALRAQELSPSLRLVVAFVNTSLGDRIRSFFPDCAVLSDSAMAAPSFVAAALGEPTPSHVRIAGRTLYLARREETEPGHRICSLIASGDAASPRLLPADEPSAGLVLAVADGTARDPLLRQRRHPARAVARMARALLWHKMGVAFACLIAVLVLGFALLTRAVHYSPENALYLTLLDAAGAAVTSARLTGPEKFAQFLLTFDGMAFLPLVTAAIVGARLAGSARIGPAAISDHVIVAGLGNVGARVVGQLHDLGVPVVCIDKDPSAEGVPLARRLGLRVVTGESYRGETLRAASISTCQAIVTVSDDDIVNLQTALQARELAAQPRVVMRLYDDDLAERVQQNIGNALSRSVSYLAAPQFAAAMLEHQVLRTIPVGRHVLLIAEVPVAAGSELAGRQIQDVHDNDSVRLIALRRRGGGAADGSAVTGGSARVDWSPPPDYVIAPQDRLFVLATRAGLSRVLARSQPR
jgi:Trk K+ transport system NAD-binding subunit